MKFYKICVNLFHLWLVKRICKDIISKLTWLKSGQILSGWNLLSNFKVSLLFWLLIFFSQTQKYDSLFPTTEIWYLTPPSNPTLLNMVTDNHLNGHFWSLFILFVKVFMTYEYFLCRDIILFSIFALQALDVCLLVIFDLYD